MKRNHVATTFVILTLLFGLGSPVGVAADNRNSDNKKKARELNEDNSKVKTPSNTKNSEIEKPASKKVETSNSVEPKASSTQEPKTGKSEKSKPIENENNRSDNTVKTEKTEKTEKVNENSESKKRETNSKTKTVEVLDSSQSSACKSAERAKRKVSQNLCYDFIVVFKPGLNRKNSEQLISDSGARKLRDFSEVFNGALVNGPLGKMQALAKNPNVLVVEDDLEVTTTDIQISAPWGLDRIDQSALPLNQLFDDRNESGINTFAYVVDTGIEAAHIDFEGRVTGGFTAVLDGRGATDCNGHGTHVAGTIGGKVHGVAKKVTLVPVRVLDCAGSGSYSSVISGLDWIAANHPVGAPAVVNMSLGGPASSTLDGAIRNLIAKGITVVVAAGNSSADACNYSPARVAEAITVAATTVSDVRASYSNFGSCVDIFAPGSEITSTWIGANSTNTISGTSMASPHVAGVLAGFITSNSTLTPGQIANSLIASATNGVVISTGTNSPNKLLFAYLTPDTTSAVPVDSSPTFKKVTPRGKKR